MNKFFGNINNISVTFELNNGVLIIENNIQIFFDSLLVTVQVYFVERTIPITKNT